MKKAMNKLSEGGNLIWESSRMILPEHKARIREHDLTPQPKSRPLLSADQLDILNQQLKLACATSAPVVITYYKNKQHLTVSGKNSRS